MALVIPEQLERTPFASHQEIQPAIVIHIRPNRACDETGLFEIGCDRVAGAFETSIAIYEQIAPRCGRVLSWHETAAHEDIEIAVAVEIGGSNYAAGVARAGRPGRVRGFAERTAPVVEIKLGAG